MTRTDTLCPYTTECRSCMVDGFEIEVLPRPYHMQPMPMPRRSDLRRALKLATSTSSFCQCGLSAAMQSARPAECSSFWLVEVRSPARKIGRAPVVTPVTNAQHLRCFTL